MPSSVSLGFFHATRGGMDRELELSRGADGVYRADFAPLAAGAWDLQVAADDWRLVGRLGPEQRHRLELRPSPRP